MLNPPLTKEEAIKTTYGGSAFTPAKKWNPERCAYEVWSDDGWHSRQCNFKNGYGPSELYCKRHAKMVYQQLESKKKTNTTIRRIKMKNGLQMKYFVLNPTKEDAYGDASRKAILTYAETIEKTNPYLARDLRDWIKQLSKKEEMND